jgi:hypothetical protein
MCVSPLAAQIVVHLTEDLLSRASMTVVNGCPTLTINISTAREHWLEGMLRHEIGRGTLSTHSCDYQELPAILSECFFLSNV